MSLKYETKQKYNPSLTKGTIPRTIVDVLLEKGSMPKKELLKQLKKRGIDETTAHGRISELKGSNLIRQNDEITVTSLGKRKVASESN